MNHPRLLLSFAAATLTSLAVPGGALAEEDIKQGCAAAYESTQELKLGGKLVDALDRATYCAQPDCPAVVRNACAKWTTELQGSVPSVVVVARQGDTDLSEVRVFVDGELAVDDLTGEPVAMDPGRHQLRFEHGDAEPIEREILIAVGVQNRLVEVTFGDPSSDEPDDQPGLALPPEEEGLPVLGFALMGLGVASAAVFAALATVGTGEVDDLRASCGATESCNEADVDDAKVKIIVGDVFLGVGVLSAGIGAALVIAHYVGGEAESDSALRWAVVPTPDGGAGMVELRF